MPLKNLIERRKYQRLYALKHPEKMNVTCGHGKVKTRCKQCGGGAICKHERRRDQCRICSPDGRKKCPHGKFKWNCDMCGGLKRCEKHGRVARTCRICYPKFWAQRILSRHKQDACKGRYSPPRITPKELLEFLKTSPNCCGCGSSLNYDGIGFDAPCLHHNHETGEMIGFAHRECNAFEGQFQKLGHDRIILFLKNFFPLIVEELKAHT